MMKKNLSILFSIIILSMVIGFGVRFVFAQIGWYEPTGTPPEDNEIPLWVRVNNDLYFTTGGNLGVGTTGPASLLDVNGTAQLRGSAGGTGLYVDSSGRVGIGTTNPAGRRLTVLGNGINGIYGNGDPVGVEGIANVGGIGVYGAGGSTGVYGRASSATGIAVRAVGGYYGIFTDGTQYGLYSNSGTNYFAGSVGIGTTSPAQLLDVRGNAYVSGNAGIGTTAPNDKLEVAGNIRLTGGQYTVQAVGADLTLNADASNDIIFSQNGTEMAGIYDGKLGIRTDQPSGTLTVLGDLKVFSYNVSTYRYVQGPSVYRPSGPRCGCDLDSNASADCPPLFYTNTDYGFYCNNLYNRGNYGYRYTRTYNAPALYVSTSGNVGIGTTKPQTKLDVAGDARFESTVTGLSFVNQANIFQIGTTDNYYSRTVGKTYVVEVGPSNVGSVVQLPELTELCYSEVGYRCQITLGMKNWDTNKPNLLASRGPYHFSYTGSWWRIANNDVEGKDNNAATNEWSAWDCIFTDAERFVNTNNGRSDSAAGFGLLNVKGGSFSDSSTGCVLIVEDITGALVKTGYLVNGLRTETECTQAGGTVTTVSGGDKICKFAQNSCPSSWLQYNSYSTTQANSCSGEGKNCLGMGCGGQSNCTTGSHAWSDAGTESCGYKDEVCRVYGCSTNSQTCYASVTEVGCY